MDIFRLPLEHDPAYGLPYCVLARVPATEAISRRASMDAERVMELVPFSKEFQNLYETYSTRWVKNLGNK